MATQKTNESKFNNMTYEEAVTKLSVLISVLEKGEGSFDELMEVYKEAFEYYTYCSEYLNSAGEKMRELNSKIASLQNPLED